MCEPARQFGLKIYVCMSRDLDCRANIIRSSLWTSCAGNSGFLGLLTLTLTPSHICTRTLCVVAHSLVSASSFFTRGNCFCPPPPFPTNSCFSRSPSPYNKPAAASLFLLSVFCRTRDRVKTRPAGEVRELCLVVLAESFYPCLLLLKERRRTKFATPRSVCPQEGTRAKPALSLSPPRENQVVPRRHDQP